MLRNHVEIESFYREQFIEYGAIPRGVAWADAIEHYKRTTHALRLVRMFHEHHLPNRTLEIGCGYGYLPYIWELQGESFREYTGVDLTSELIEYARNVPWPNGSGSNKVFVSEPFEEFKWIDPYDLTIAIGVIAWQPERQAVEILRRLWDATKPGGWMLFTYLPFHPLGSSVIHMLRTQLSVVSWVEYSGYCKSGEHMIMFRKGEEVREDDNTEPSSEGTELV